MPDTQISDALGLIDGGLQLLLAAAHADDPKREMLVRVGDLLRDVRSLEAALSGCAVVPREPTVVQMDAAGSLIAEYVRKMKAAGGGVDAMDYALRVVIYRAMIQAAPPVPAVEG